MTPDALVASMIDYGPLAVVIGATIAGLVLAFAVADSLNGPARRKQKRLDSLRGRLHSEPQVSQAADVTLKRDTNFSAVPVLDRLLRQLLPRPEKLRLRLNRTGRKISLAKYALFSLGLAVTVMLTLLLWFRLSPLLSGLIGVTIGVGLPHYVIGLMVGRRQKKFLTAFPEAIDLMVRGLKSGLPITETINTVGNEMKDPVGTEFRQIAESVRLGETPEKAVYESVVRTGLYELNFFVTALSVQRETGGTLTGPLGNLSEVLRKRRQRKLRVKAMSSEARASAMIIGSLPFVMFTLIYIVNPDYIMKLFIDPRGMILIGIGLGLMAVGTLVMVKMVKFEI